jgi:hypothetical protein
MSVFDIQALNKEHIKVRWKEPYVSHGLNRSKFGVEPRGIFSGFNIVPVGYRSYQVNGTIDPLPFHGDPNSYNKGAYAAVSGYSIALFEDTLGHNTTISIPPNSVSGTFDFDFSGMENQQKILALDVDYFLSNETSAQILAVDAAEMISNPDYLVIGVINVPDTGVSASVSDIDFNDVTYPRTMPFADPHKYGYMSPAQASILLGIGDEAETLYSSDNDANVWWRLFEDVSGHTVGRLDFTGNIDFNIPTKDFNLRIFEAGDVVSGINDNDIVYFMYPTDGSVSGVIVQVAPNNHLPSPLPEEQLIVFGMRRSDDFWFKNGLKWEVGELKPFGVTSKYPNLRVGETGNPPLSDSVSGIFFDNAQVQVLPGQKDVRIYVNVSGQIPDQPIEETIVAYEGQTSFTMTNPALFWVLDNHRKDITVFRNGGKAIPLLDITSGLTYSTGDLVAEYQKTGTRTIELFQPAMKDTVITVRLEANKGYYAEEEYYVITAVSGTVYDIFTTRPFHISNDLKDISIFQNGAKVQYGLPIDPLVQAASKVSENQLTFTEQLPLDAVICIRWESDVAMGTSTGGGIHWYDPVDSNITPLYDNFYDLGLGKRFKSLNLGGDIGVGGDAHIGGKLSVSGGIDPIYLQFEPVHEGDAPPNSLYCDIANANALTFKNTFGGSTILAQGSSGSSIEEEELMINPYPFDIVAPKAMSVSGIGNFMLLTDYSDPQLVDNYFGILTQNVSAFGSGYEIGTVRWRGKFPVSGFNNGAIFVSGVGELVQSAPSVSGHGILKTGIVKNDILFLRPTEGFNL